MNAVNAADHVGLVWHLANKWSRRSGSDLEDLAQEGMLGLLRACEKFDPSLGYAFATYAQWWINSFIMKFYRDKSRAVRLPRAEYQEKKSANWIESLNAVVRQAGDVGEQTKQDMLEDESPSPEAECARKEESEIIWREVGCLSGREAEVLRLRFVDGLTLEQVGEGYGLTRERIRQIESKALEKLRKRLDAAL